MAVIERPGLDHRPHERLGVNLAGSRQTATQLLPDVPWVPRGERREVYDHLYLLRACRDGLTAGLGLDCRGIGSERMGDQRNHLDVRAVQPLHRTDDVRRWNAHSCHVVLERHRAEVTADASCSSRPQEHQFDGLGRVSDATDHARSLPARGGSGRPKSPLDRLLLATNYP